MMNWKQAVRDCMEARVHLTSCNDDGYCNFCGYQESLPEVTTQNIGNKPIGDGQTVIVDHTVQTFIVTVRSSAVIVGVDTIKKLIEEWLEVTDIQEIKNVAMIKRPG